MQFLLPLTLMTVLVSAIAQFTIDELLNRTFPLKISDDIYLDPCKADIFYGDVALSIRHIDQHASLKMKKLLKNEDKQDVSTGADLEESHENKSKGESKKNVAMPRHRKPRAVTARSERVWDYGVIPYEIDGNFSGAHKALFKQAMRHWENATCVKFVERNEAEHPNYIYFTEGTCGCCSFVGKQGNGGQAISIGKTCDKFGIVVHELGHVVGFWHEHTRPDRDQHVDILRENIMEGQEYNFNKLNAEEVNSLGRPYDYDSIMHYARNTLSKGIYLDTILPLDKSGMSKRPEIGQRIRLSAGDIAQTSLLYKCPECGRTYQDRSAHFSHPATLNGQGVSCEWRISATHGETILLNITDLDIYESENCTTDYLEVLDGYWQKSAVIDRLCGKQDNKLIVSTGARLTLSLVTSQGSLQHRGFSASYEAVCGGDIFLTEPKGHLESPNFPEDYNPGKECVWNISVKEGYQIGLKFQSFEIENHDNCAYDYVEVRDGHGTSATLIGRYCGYQLPPDIKSTGDKLSVKFVSDGSVEKAGFSGSFILEQDECSNPEINVCEQLCVNTLGGYECACHIGYNLKSDRRRCEHECGGLIEAANGTLVSPSFPDLYPKNKRCIWEIVASPQFRITLNFTHFDIEGNNVVPQECVSDKIEVFSKMDDDFLNRQGVFCGSLIPPPITSEGNRLRVEFTSDGTVEKSGFAAIFFTDFDECAVNNGGCQQECENTIGSFICSCYFGFNLHDNGRDCLKGDCTFEITAPYGVINSPNYPEEYPNRSDCVWHLTTRPGHRIKLQFTNFEVELHQGCGYDFVVIYDGESSTGVTLGRFCGFKLPHTIVTSRNHLYMVFKSDNSVQRNGFRAVHSTVCGGRLQATSEPKHLYSHANFEDDNYPDEMKCDWSIEAGYGRGIQLKFDKFEVEEEHGCSYDYVQVSSGFDIYGQFCGNSNPTDIISENEKLLVRFRSDDSVTGKGWSATYWSYDPADTEDNQEEVEEEEYEYY